MKRIWTIHSEPSIQQNTQITHMQQQHAEQQQFGTADEDES